ncbi:DUF3243 domain-containing protein [Oceanobacillus locisalsi]|uniref:DUF3243 domain-containing protein n=1 Tax=Oceanobacillus locisalsi TaxID=546107 RepID=A0ABW3NF64_9BACI
MSVLDNFDSWKDFLKGRLQQAEESGINHETLTDLAAEVGDYLAESVDAKTPEEEVLKALWSTASEEEQQALASTMIKLVQKHD